MNMERKCSQDLFPADDDFDHLIVEDDEPQEVPLIDVSKTEMQMLEPQVIEKRPVPLQ